MNTFKTYIAVTVILTQVFWPMSGYANPIGEDVTSGSASFDRTIPNTLVVNQGTDKLITNWQDFSISANETTRFIQPSNNSVALNRVVGGNPSNIFGALQANGKVFLVNQNGILFAPGSQVNVGGLIASTLDINDGDFLAGRYTFFGKGGSVVNQGQIVSPGGFVALLGSNVENISGMIEANLGTVVLASGEAMTLNLDPQGMISVVIDQATSQNLGNKEAAIKNTGNIKANGGKVILTAKNLDGVFAKAINNGGSISATKLSLHDGVVELVADGAEVFNSAAIDATKLDVKAKNTDFANQGSIQVEESIKIVADGDINLPGGSMVVSSPTGGTIGLEAGKNVKIGGVIRDDAGEVTIKAKKEISNLWGPNAVNIVAKDVKLTAVEGIGTTESVVMDVTNLTAHNSGSGKIDIKSTKSFNAKSVTNSGEAAGDDIVLKTTAGSVRDIEVGKVSAAGLGEVKIDAAGNITDTDGDSVITANKVNLTADNAIGSKTNRINTNVNDLSGISKNVGDININQATAVTISDLRANSGSIDVTAHGKITAANVIATGGTDSDSINLKTTYGDIEVGKVSAAGAGNVALDSAANITDNDGDSMVTANKLNLTAGINGNVVGTQLLLGSDVNTYVVDGHQVLAIHNKPGAATYNVYFRSGFSGDWQQVGTQVAASAGSTTIWVDPTQATGGFASYYVEVVSAATNAIGSNANRINTNANDIAGLSKVQPGDIYLHQAKDVTLSNLRNRNGLIDVTAAGKINAVNVSTSGGQGKTITLKTSSGDIEVGKVNASAGLSDVDLSAAASILDDNGDSLVTANNFRFLSGNVVGTRAPVNIQIANDHVVLNIQNVNGSAGYNVYSRSSFSEPWQLVAANYAASNGASTQWIDPATLGASSFYMVEIASAEATAVGSSANRINTNVNDISGLSNAGSGDVYLKQSTAVTLSNVRNNNGSVDIIANGKLTAANVITTGGTEGDRILLKTTFSDIEVGKVTAEGAGNVTLDSAANITDADGDSMVTANKLNVTAGINASSVGAQLLLGTDVNTYVVDGHQVLAINNKPGAAGYNIYYRVGFSGPWQQVATQTASTGSTTIWTDPALADSGVFASYYVEVATAGTNAVGSSANRINTNVNDIAGLSKAAAGDIYLNQAKAVTVSDLRNNNGSIDVVANGDINVTRVDAAGDVSLDSVNGSILGAGSGAADEIHVTSTGDTRLHAGNVVGSWAPYVPLNVKVGRDLHLSMNQRNSVATGSVGSMPVSGSLGGSVGGTYHFSPGARSYNLTTAVFTGNPPGYIFFNQAEIWPNFAFSTISSNATLSAQISNTIQRNQDVYYEILAPHLVRQIEVAAPTTVYAYHPLVESDSSAFDSIDLDPEAYDYIDGRINVNSPLGTYYSEEDEKKK